MDDTATIRDIETFLKAPERVLVDGPVAIETVSIQGQPAGSVWSAKVRWLDRVYRVEARPTSVYDPAIRTWIWDESFTQEQFGVDYIERWFLIDAEGESEVHISQCMLQSPYEPQDPSVVFDPVWWADHLVSPTAWYWLGEDPNWMPF